MARLAVRLTSPVEQDAVVQAALATAWRTRSGYDESQGSVESWLLAMVVETASGRGRRGGGAAGELIDLPPPTAVRNSSRGLDDAITELSGIDRLAVELTYLVGLDVTGVAAVLACDPSEARATVDDALRQLNASAAGGRSRPADGGLEDRLRELGEVYRSAHQRAPAVDWERVTASRRGRVLVAVAGAVVVVAVAALVVHLDGSSGSPHRTSSPPVTAVGRPDALRGAPPYLYGLRDGDLLEQHEGTSLRAHGSGRPDETLGVTRDGDAAYVAAGFARCRTFISREQTTLTTGSGLGSSITLAGQAVGVPMAVSPNGQRLAIVLQPRTRGATGSHAQCNGREVIDILDPHHGHVVASYPMPVLADADSLQWSPNDVTLAFRIAPSCVSCDIPSPGTHLLDTSTPASSAATAKPLLPLIGHGVPYGPVFWWHGQLVVPFEGALWSLNGHGVDQVVASGLPRTGVVDTVSSDPTGDHLLFTSNRLAYRWDNGLRSRVPRGVGRDRVGATGRVCSLPGASNSVTPCLTTQSLPSP
jgi:DNA-directed RNA polymerase specialized sigma24 family protein